MNANILRRGGSQTGPAVAGTTIDVGIRVDESGGFETRPYERLTR